MKETQVVIIEKADVVNTESEHCDSLYPKAECKAAELFSVVAHMPEYLGMYHAGSQHLQPAGLGTYPAALASAYDALNIYFRTGFCKRKEARSEAYQGIRIKYLLDKGSQYPLETGKGDIPVHHKPFHLMKHRGMSYI